MRYGSILSPCDILADAKEINEERAAADEAAVVADEAAEDKAAE